MSDAKQYLNCMLISIISLRPDLPSHQNRTLLLKCDACGKEFSFKYKRRIAEKLKHYCDRKCAAEGKKINPSVPRIRQLTCEFCQRRFERVCNTNQTDPRMCSRSCAASITSSQLNLVANMQTPEVRAKAMKTRSSHWKDGTIVPGMKGKHFPCSDETKAILREKSIGMKNAFFGKKHSEETKQKMRESRSQLILAGRMNWRLFGHKSGTHLSSKIGKNVHYRSSWEEIVMKYLDSSSEVLTWDYECVRIPYYYSDNKRWYVPDFIVTFQDGHREMWEVKPKEFVGLEKMMLKSEAAKKWCLENDVEKYCVIDNDKLHSLKHHDS